MKKEVPERMRIRLEIAVLKYARLCVKVTNACSDYMQNLYPFRSHQKIMYNIKVITMTVPPNQRMEGAGVISNSSLTGVSLG